MPKRRNRQIPGGPPNTPRQASSNPRAGLDAPIRFRLAKLDNGDHALHEIEREHHKRLLSALVRLEGMTVAQAKTNHDISVIDDLRACPNKSAATKIRNILESYGDDFDGSVAEMRVEKSGPLRLIGFLSYAGTVAEFFLLWWDPKHEFWPEGKTKR